MKTPGYEWTAEDVFEKFQAALCEFGEAVSANQYDQLSSDKPGYPSRSTIQRFLGPWSIAKSKALDASNDENRRQLLAAQNKTLFARLDAERDRNQVFIDNCLASISKCSFKSVKRPAKTKSKVNLEFHAIRSDAHVGDYVDAAWVQGVSRYSADLYVERVGLWTDKVVTFREEDQGSLGLNKLVIDHLGDQCTGEGIYNGQPFYLDLSLTDQLFKSVEVEANAILTLAEVFPEVEIFCVIGNHGRPGRKGDNHHRTNFDYIFYRCLQTALAPQKNVSVYVSESPTMLVRHGGFNFALTHGDAAQSWAGIPYYGREREFQRLPGLYNMVIDYELVGHHHTPGSIGGYILMNGSLKGADDLSVNKMRRQSRPSQEIFYFHPEHGINRRTTINLADPIHLEADENGIYTAYEVGNG